MSKLVIKMVYNPNVSRYSQSQSPNFSSNSYLQVTKTKQQIDEITYSNSEIGFWQDDHEDLNLPSAIIGCMFFVFGLVLFISSLFLQEINEVLSKYRELFILLTLWGWIILDPKLELKHNDQTSLGN